MPVAFPVVGFILAVGSRCFQRRCIASARTAIAGRGHVWQRMARHGSADGRILFGISSSGQDRTPRLAWSNLSAHWNGSDGQKSTNAGTTKGRSGCFYWSGKAAVFQITCEDITAVISTVGQRNCWSCGKIVPSLGR